MKGRKEVVSIQRKHENGQEILKVVCTDLSEVVSIDHGVCNSSPKINITVVAMCQDKTPPYLIGNGNEKCYTLMMSNQVEEFFKKNGYWSQSGMTKILNTLNK